MGEVLITGEGTGQTTMPLFEPGGKGIKTPDSYVVSDTEFEAWQQRLTDLGIQPYSPVTNLRTDGALFVDRDGTPVGWKRPDIYGTSGETTAADVQPITSWHERNPLNALADVEMGLEWEYPHVDAQGKPSHGAFDPDSDLIAKLIAIQDEREQRGESLPNGISMVPSPELYSSTGEWSSGHSPDIASLALGHVALLKATFRETAANGAWPMPTDAVTFKTGRGYFNQHPYVQHLVAPDNSLLPSDSIEGFVGHTVQMHYERAYRWEDMAATANLFQILHSVVAANTQAGSVAYGQLQPNLSEIFARLGLEMKLGGTDEGNERIWAALDNNQWRSVRNPSRLITNAGTYQHAVPETYDGLIALGHEVLTPDSPLLSGPMPSPARKNDHHNDRMRDDIGKNGTLEDCAHGTSLGNVLVQISTARMLEVLAYKLQKASFEGTLGDLHKSRPMLFPAEVNDNALRTAELNLLAVAQGGHGALVSTADGEVVENRVLYLETLDYVNEPMPDEDYDGLPPALIDILYRVQADLSDEVATNYLDEHGLVSVAGYYETHIGSAGEWTLKRANQLAEKFEEGEFGDLTEEEVIEQYFNAHIRDEYAKYITDFEPSNVLALLSTAHEVALFV